MKQLFLNFTGKKFITAAFLSASVLLTSVNAHAAKHTSFIEILSDETTGVQYTGSTDDALLFKVNVANENGKNFTLKISDEAGDVLYSQSFNNVNFQKQFKLLKGDQVNQHYTFNITSEDKKLNQTYVVTAASHTIEDVAVNKL